MPRATRPMPFPITKFNRYTWLQVPAIFCPGPCFNNLSISKQKAPILNPSYTFGNFKE